MLNQYKIIDDYVIIYIQSKKHNRLFEVYIDLDDLEEVKKHTWNIVFNKTNNEFYATTSIYYTTDKGESSFPLWMSRYILNIRERNRSIHVDHINHNTLDNRKENLRMTSNSKNLRNRNGANSNNKSGYRNVSWHEHDNRWVVQLMVNGKNTIVGRFKENELDKAGEFAKEM